MTAAMPAALDNRRLPELREDLELRSGTQSALGGAGYLIYDALRHKYIQIDAMTFAILSLWKTHATAAALSESGSRALGFTVSREEIDRLAAFLETNQLTDNGAASGWKQQYAGANRRHSPMMWLLHNYLFIKVPIFAPERLLRATYSLVSVFYNRRMQLLVLLLGVLGLYLVSREWEKFLFEARDLATLSGAATFVVVLFLIKGLHELGHAYTAFRYGCRVPTIGLAFMMMAPMLYTDVTDAWRLRDRKKRLAIDAAGITVEIGLACIATLFWVFLPDGLSRHLAFLIATTSWIMSLAVNLNPFMRFDGYYIFSDFLRVPNLQERAFTLGIWKLREILFRLKAPCPEVMPQKLRAILIAYAYGVCIYRLILFTGIALLVYAYFFKALGIILFLFEIVYFILRPAFHEIREWWKMRGQIMKSRRSALSFGILLALAVLAVIPWSTRVQIPALLEGNKLARVYPPRPGRIAAIHVVAGQYVNQGDVLIKLEAPDVVQERRVAQARLDAVELRLARQSADSQDRNAKQIHESERSALKMQLSGLAKQVRELDIRAPGAGVISEFNPALREQQWIAAKEQIALIDSSDGHKVVGYVAEDNLWRLETGATGRFIPDVPLGDVIDVTLTEIAATGAAGIEIQELASLNGGPIEAQPDARQRLISGTAQYLVTMRGTNGVAQLRSTVRGTVQIEARAESFLSGFYRRVLKILIRESGV